MPDPIKPTAADREALERIDDALGFLLDNEREIVLQAFARHAQQAREQAAKVADEYAAYHDKHDDGLSGFDKMALGAREVAEEIRALKEQPPC